MANWESPNMRRRRERIPEREETPKGAYELLMEANLNQRIKDATPLEQELYAAFGLEPGLDRAAMLPVAGSRDEGNLQLAVPEALYSLLKTAAAPGAAAKGVPISPDETLETAMNTMGSGLALSSPVEGAVAGMAVKRKGGNWLRNSIENQTENFKTPADVYDAPKKIIDEFLDIIEPNEYQGFSDPDYAENLEYFIRDKYPDVYRDLLPPNERAINNWIDTKLNKYIKNEMGTPEDPMLALADSGRRMHMEPLGGGAGFSNTRRARYREGFPIEGYATTPRGSDWESMADTSISGSTPAFFMGSSRFGKNEAIRELNPWLEKIDPKSRVYRINQARLKDLNFQHLIDELANATDPNTTLPQHLRIDPDKLDRMTVPQISEKVGNINAWRAEEAARAESAGMMTNLQATPRLEAPNLNLSFVDKPGGKWVDVPDTVDREGMTLCTSIGKSGGWCTQDGAMAEHYGSGNSRLIALLDADGRPHVQAAIVKNTRDAKGAPPDILELKPPGNDFNSARAEEYARRDPQYQETVTQSVLDFLNEGNWGEVNDLEYFDIIDTALRGGDKTKGIKFKPFPGPRFVTEEQWDAINNANKNNKAKGGMINAPTETPANYSKGRWRLI